MTSGATGQLYGNRYTWTFPSDWKSHLDTRAVDQLGYMKKLFTSLGWYTLIPDQTHSLLTAGYGTYSAAGDVLDNDYTTAASSDDGTLAVVYSPTIRTLTIDLTGFCGPVTARWYDPSIGIFTPATGSPLGNDGTHQFTPHGVNDDGKSDWVLVLQAH